jgi:hypothetical protein
MRDGLLSVLVVVGCMLAACNQATEPQDQPSSEALLTQLRARLGPNLPEMYYSGTDAHGDHVYKELKRGPLELHVLVRRRVNGENVVCGWAGSPPQRLWSGGMTRSDDTIFIVRNGRLFLSQDVPAHQFEKWQTDLCGDQWVKPITNLPFQT